MKKIFGYLFLVLGFFLAFAITLYVLSRLPHFFQADSQDTAYNVGYWLGTLFFFGIIIGIIVLLVRTGFRWIKKTNKRIEVYPDIIDAEPFENK